MIEPYTKGRREQKFSWADHSFLLSSILWAILLVCVLCFWPRAEPVVEEPIAPAQTVIVQSCPVCSSKEKEVQSSEVVKDVKPSEESEVVEPRYGFTDDDLYLLAVLMCGDKTVDGDGEFDYDYDQDDRYDQISLVLCVVMNRVRSDLFPNTVSEVIWQTGQFSLMPKWKHGLPEVSDIALQRVTEWCSAYDNYDYGIQSIPEDHLYFSGDGQVNRSR